MSEVKRNINSAANQREKEYENSYWWRDAQFSKGCPHNLDLKKEEKKRQRK